MGDLLLGAVAAVMASVLFSVGLVFQSLEARAVPPGHALRLSLITELLARPRWVLGCVIMIAGFALHVTALLLAPLTVVQPSLAAGIVVLLLAGARAERTPITQRQALAVLAVSAGVVGLTLTASERQTVTAGAGRLALALCPLGAVAVLPFLVTRLGRRWGGALTATLGAGAAYALTGLTTKLVSDRLAQDDWAGVSLWLGITVAAAAVALVDQSAALQRRGAVYVGVTIYVLPVVVPVVLSAAVFREGWGSSPTSAVLLGLSVATVCAGAAALAGAEHVRALEGASPKTG
jgi:hypothetical protein